MGAWCAVVGVQLHEGGRGRCLSSWRGYCRPWRGVRAARTRAPVEGEPRWALVARVLGMRGEKDGDDKVMKKKEKTATRS